MCVQFLATVFVHLQVQCELFCAKWTYCDFVVWTEKEVNIEQIYPDNAFGLNMYSE